MSPSRPVLALFAVLVALAPAATAVGLDTGSHAVTVPGQSADADTQDTIPDRSTAPADANAGVDLITQDGQVVLTGPSCNIETSDMAVSDDSGCTTAALHTTLPQASVDYYVTLRLGEQQEQLSGNAPAPDAASTSLMGAPVDSTPVTLLVITAAAGGLGLAYLVWRIAKLGLIGAFVPLATHIRDDQLLDDANRRAIHTLIKNEPGIAPKEMAERLGLAWGTVTHHLAKLERRRIVVSKKYGKYRRYFLNGGTTAPEDKDKVAVLKVARTADVATYIRDHPGKSQKEVSASMGVSSSTILWHVKRLLDVRAINRVRVGKEVRYYPVATTGGEIIIHPPAPVESTPTFHA